MSSAPPPERRRGSGVTLVVPYDDEEDVDASDLELDPGLVAAQPGQVVPDPPAREPQVRSLPWWGWILVGFAGALLLLGGATLLLASLGVLVYLSAG